MAKYFGWLEAVPWQTTFATGVVFGAWAVSGNWSWPLAVGFSALFVAYFFAGRSLELGRRIVWTRQQMERQLKDANDMLALACRYRELRQRHFLMTGEDYGAGIGDEKPPRTYQA